jgi:hypothetical protein
MARTQSVVKKLYNETVSGDIVLDSEALPVDIIRECNDKKTLCEHDGFYMAFCKAKHEDQKCVRMIFAIKEGNKVKNISKIMDMIKNLESVFVYMDQCLTSKENGFSYIDAIKMA